MSREKLPEASAVAVCSPFSERIKSVALGVVVPERVMESVATRDSSSGEDITREVVGETGDGDGATAALGEGWGKFLRLWLAVQIPKVMIRPKANPMEIARMTSFFISGWRIS